MAYSDLFSPEEMGQFGIEEENTTDDFYAGQRGTMMDVVSLAGRSAISGLEMIEDAAEYFGMNDSAVDSAAKLRQFDLFQPDLDEYLDKGWLSDTWAGSIPSAVEALGGSLASGGAGALAGAAIGSAVPGAGTMIGGITGFVLGTVGVMGAGTWQSTYEEGKAGGLSDEDSRILAGKTAAVEVGGELLGGYIGLGPLKKVVAQPLKKTLSLLLKASPTAMAKEFGGVYLKEQATEFTQEGLQNKFMQDAGLSDVSSVEAMLKTVIPTLFMTGAFQLGTQTYSARQRAAIKEKLKGTPEERMAAISIVTQNLKKEDTDLSNSWDLYAKMQVRIGKDISWDEDFANFASQVTLAHAQPITQARILTGEGLTEAVDAELSKGTGVPLPEGWVDTTGVMPPAQKKSAADFKNQQINAQMDAKMREAGWEQEDLPKAETPEVAAARTLAKADTPVVQPAIQPVEPTDAEVLKKADLLGAIGNVPITGSNAELVGEQGLRETSFVGSPEESGESAPDMRTKTLANYKLDPALMRSGAENISDGVIGTIPGVEGVEYSIMKTTSGEYVATSINTTSGSRVSTPIKNKVVAEDGTVTESNTFPDRKSAAQAVDLEVKDILKNTETTGWIGGKKAGGTEVQANFGGSNYVIKRKGKQSWEVTKDGELFANPKAPKGGWGKGALTGVQGIVEEISGVQPVVPETVVPSKAPTVTPKALVEPLATEVKDGVTYVATPEEGRPQAKGAKRPTVMEGFDGQKMSPTLRRNLKFKLNTMENNIGNIPETIEGKPNPVYKRAQQEITEINAALDGTKNKDKIDLKSSTKAYAAAQAEAQTAFKEKTKVVEERLKKDKAIKSNVVLTDEDLAARAELDMLKQEQEAELEAERQAEIDQNEDEGNIYGATPNLKIREKDNRRTQYDMTALEAQEAGFWPSDFRSATPDEITGTTSSDIYHIDGNPRVLKSGGTWRAGATEAPGTPTEKNAREIILKAAKEGDPLAKALLAKVDARLLEGIPVVHTPNGRSEYDGGTNEIRLRGNDTWVKVHEVLHGITARQMETNPVLKKEVETLMSDTLKSLPEGTLSGYQTRTPQEFIAQIQTNPELVTHMKSAGKGKLNLWQRFVDFVRRAIGLPQSRMSLLERALDITVRLSEAPVEAQEGMVLGGIQGIQAKTADTGRIDEAVKLEREGETQKDILKTTGWFKFSDGKWRFYVPDTDVEITRAGVKDILERIDTENPLGMISRPLGEFANIEKLLEAYPDMKDTRVKIIREDSAEYGSYSILENLITLNVGAYPSTTRMDNARDTLLHEIQHAIQKKEGFTGGASASIQKEINVLILRNQLLDSASKVLEESPAKQEILDVLSDESIDETASIIAEENNMPFSLAKVMAISAAVETINDQYLSEYETIREDALNNNPELFERMDYEETYASIPNNIDAVLELASQYPDLTQDTYERILGEAEARLASLLARNEMTSEEFQDRFNPEKFEKEERTIVPTEGELGEVSDVSFNSVGAKPKMTPAEREKYVVEEQKKDNPPSDEGFLGVARQGVQKIWEIYQKYGMPVNDVLHMIDPKFAALNRIREAELSMRNKRQMQTIGTLVEKLSGLSEDDKLKFKAGWVNQSDRFILEGIIKKNGLEKEWKAWTDILKNNEKELVKWGVVDSSELINDYLPRIVKDPNGLYNALQGEDYTIIEAQVEKKRNQYEKINGKGTFGELEENAFIATLMSSGRYKSLPIPGMAKERTIGHVPSAALRFYENPLETMLSHIIQANEQIYQRSLVGNSGRAKKVQQLNTQNKILESAKEGSEGWLNAQQRAIELGQEIFDVDTDASLNIINAFSKIEGMTPEKRQKAVEVLRSRFAQVGTRGAVLKLKNYSLMMTIGNPLSAITQLGDQGFNLFDNGAYGISGIAKAITGNDRIMDNFDTDNAVKDFITSSKEGKALDWLLDKSQLKRMDIWGKESYLQGAMKRFGNMDVATFGKKVGVYKEFLTGERTPDELLNEAYHSMQLGKPNDNAMLILFSELSQRQPTSLSETSQGFLTAGNGRIFYMLKQFALRALASSVMHIHEGFTSGTPVKGVASAIGLITLLGLAGAGTDEIKNIILGRKGEGITDATLSNMMQIMFINRYAVETGITRGTMIENLIVNNLMLPPVKALDTLVKDIKDTLQGDFSYKTMASVPMFGRIAFNYTPQGAEQELARQKKYILERVANGESPGKLRGDINQLNRQIRSDMEVTKVTSKSIKAAKKRE